MCTSEEVRRIVEESAARTRKEIEDYVNEMFVRRHDGVSRTVSNQYDEIKSTLSSFTELVKSYHSRMEKAEEDITTLKTWQTGHNIEAKYIGEKIDNIQTNLSRIMWLVISGVVVALLGLVLQ